MTEEHGGVKERRRFARVGIYAITRYFCPFRDKEVGVQTRIFDISEGGALLVSFSEGIPAEIPVKMSFVVPGQESSLVTVEGKVKHTGIFDKDLYRSGIEFLKLRKQDLLAIRKYVASQNKK